MALAVFPALLSLAACTLDADIWANVTTYAGKAGEPGDNDSVRPANARFEFPELLAFDNDGNLWVVENPMVNGWPAARLRKINASGTGAVTTVNIRANPAGQFPQHAVRGIAFDTSRNIYLSNHHRHNVQKFSPEGVFLENYGPVIDDAGDYKDGPKESARFHNPSGLAWDKNNNCLYVADTYNNRIRKIDSLGNVTTLAGSAKDYGEGMGSAAKFREMVGLTMTLNGNIVVADTWNHCIRMLTPNGESSMYASYRGSWGYKDGDSYIAQVGTPQYLTTDSRGNIFFTDGTNHAIRKITPGRTVSAPPMPYNPNVVNTMPDKILGRFVSTAAGKAKWNNNDEDDGGYRDGNNKDARFNTPRGVAVAKDGTIYVADMNNHVIRMIKP